MRANLIDAKQMPVTVTLEARRCGGAVQSKSGTATARHTPRTCERCCLGVEPKSALTVVILGLLNIKAL